MRVIVFAGPTISKDQMLEILPEATVLAGGTGRYRVCEVHPRAEVILLIAEARGVNWQETESIRQFAESRTSVL